MSSALGIAATAAVLQQILRDGFAALKLGDILGVSPTVSVLAPGLIATDAEASQVNLFLYNQNRNPGWSNRELPSRDTRGERVSSAPLALDLSFLVSAHGIADYHAEILLGAVMQIFHENPFLGRKTIQEALKPGPSKPNLPKELQLSGLANQLEQLRITHLNQTIDDVSRLWSALQVPCRQSVAYLVSVLLIESGQSRRTPLPVTARNLYAMPFQPPRIDRVEQAGDPAEPILPGSTLRLKGANLTGGSLTVTVNGIDLTAGITSREETAIELNLLLPDPPNSPAPPAGLMAGICVVQAARQQLMGTPPVPHGAVESNPAPFILNPDASFAVQPGAVSNVVDGVTFKTGAITVDCTPPVGVRQRVLLLLNEKNPPPDRPARAYTFSAADGNGITAPADSASSLTIPYRQVIAGSYLARLRVDAGTSPLNIGADGRFSGPEIAP